MMRRVVGGAALLMVLGTGCASVSHVQTADTLGAGKFQFAIEPGIGGAAVISDDTGSGGLYYPHVDLAARFGVADSVDLGVRFGSSLVELQSKFLLTDSRDPGKAISLAPSVSGVFLGTDDSDSVGYVNVAVPLLVGFKTRGGSELVLGPRVSATRISAGDSDDNAAVNIVSVGASVGYALRVSQSFRLMPEVGVSVPVLGEVNSSNSDSEALAGFGGGFVQFKLGFLFGSGRPINRSTDVDVDVEDIDHGEEDSDDGYED
ncbi:hypothetical protein [Pyxidicoccus xibeiensis]|uniref:hypothetical protein n=1 Tax=Pyxidicoccus xibeiensis TaxID=2906759 RepID=UPI0020A6FEE9|nr:hypothetical protein [Pyxidicoccus xibeiensis]MCP3141780.1 hypothetical protein [Pyxidicoccus xibeiensis]